MTGLPARPSALAPYRWLLVSALLVGLACVVLYLYADRDLARVVRGLPQGYKTILDQIDALGNSAWFLIPGGLGSLVLSHPGWRSVLPDRAEQLDRWYRRSLFLFTTVAISGLAAILFKIICGRPRPEEFFGQGLYSFLFFQFSSDMWSFPSGHATTIFAAMTAFSFFAPRCRPLWFLLALLVAVGRVVNGAHFPSDVLAGAFLGAATSIVLRDWFRNRNWLDFPEKERGERNPGRPA